MGNNPWGKFTYFNIVQKGIYICKMEMFQIPSSITELHSNFLQQHGISLCLKRDDLIHSEISGNKWRKLKFNVLEAKKQGLNVLLTFGGAYSNHIAATAAAGNYFGLKTIGIIRGEEGFENETIDKAKANRMALHFISREDYKRKAEIDFIEKLKERLGSFYLIPEGGANELGVIGCEEIMKEVDLSFDFVACTAGTGTTVSGICRQLKDENLIVFPALKGGDFILEEMKRYCSVEQLKKVELQLDYHFGGYAKTKPELITFYQQFLSNNLIELDLVYTSKMMFGLFNMIRNGEFKPGTKILAIHTGGVQGNKGILN